MSVIYAHIDNVNLAFKLIYYYNSMAVDSCDNCTIVPITWYALRYVDGRETQCNGA